MIYFHLFEYREWLPAFARCIEWTLVPIRQMWGDLKAGVIGRGGNNVNWSGKCRVTARNNFKF